MIMKARSRFSAYRFDDGTALFACGASSSSGKVRRRSFPLASCVVVPGCACLICPGVRGLRFLLLARARIISRRGVSCVPVVGEPRRMICFLCLFSSSHHLVRRWRLRFHPHHVPVPPRPPLAFSLLIRGQLSCGGQRALPLIRPCLILI